METIIIEERERKPTGTLTGLFPKIPAGAVLVDTKTGFRYWGYERTMGLYSDLQPTPRYSNVRFKMAEKDTPPKRLPAKCLAKIVLDMEGFPRRIMLPEALVRRGDALYGIGDILDFNGVKQQVTSIELHAAINQSFYSVEWIIVKSEPIKARVMEKIEDMTPEEAEEAKPQVEDAEKPVKRGPGRPRKNQE